MATVYYTASSLDGYIVDDHDSLDWLVARAIDADGPFGYHRFITTVGALVMGSSTYEWIAANQPEGWTYTQPAWVLTHRPEILVADYPVTAFSGEVTELHPRLVDAAGQKDVWVVGGGVTAAQFAAAGLIDEMVVSYAPCSLGAGARVLPLRSEWALAEVDINGDFVCVRWTSSGPSDAVL